MSFLDGLTKALDPIGGLVKGVKDIISTFRLDPKEAKELEMELLKLQIQAEQQIRDHQRELEKAYIEDSKSLREQIKSEIESEDPFVRRARPAWVWGLLFLYLVNYGATTIVGWFEPSVKPVEIPELVHMLTGGIILGYGYLRTIEKTSGKAPFSK